MANEDTLHKCVTEFLFDTCRYTKINCYSLMTLVQSTVTKTASGISELFCSGSSAEFYITPMLPCIGDLDQMQCINDCIAIPPSHTPPTQLPANFQCIVIVYEMIYSHQPGYVYLKESNILTRNDNGRCVVEKIENSEDAPEFLGHDYTMLGELVQNIKKLRDLQNKPIIQRYLSNAFSAFMHVPAVEKSEDAPGFLPGLRELIQDLEKIDMKHKPIVQRVLNSLSAYMHGPAIGVHFGTQQHELEDYRIPFLRMRPYGEFPNADIVHCIRCLLWPPQAANWLSRSRHHGVPDQTTINIVVSNGCDVVGAVHPLCRQDEWMNKYQWRLSFSRAEVTLLNSWTPVQQIIYHMLRFVLKREVLSKTSENDPDLPTPSNYHIKTLMLWECEEKPQSWWSAEFSLIKLCSSLLHKLCGWVEDKRCQHYFISSCNLIDHFQDASHTICCKLRWLADSSVMLLWFITNYIYKCAQFCPEKVSALFEGIRSIDKLRRAIRAVADWKLSMLTEDICNDHCFIQLMLLGRLQTYRGDRLRTHMLTKDLQNFDPTLRDYYTAAASLHVAYTISINLLTEDHLEMLWSLVDPLTSRFESGAFLWIERAIKLSRLSNFHRSALDMLHNEMSKAYLHQSLAYGQESTYCVVHVLLAALDYKSGHYRTAIDHCKQVLSQCDRDQYGLHTIGAEYLPQIDDSVDAVFGLILLYQKVQTNALNSDNNSQPNSEVLTAFTTELLSRYLYSKCSAVVTKKDDKVKKYRQHLSQTKPLLLSDVLLFKAMEIELDECTETSVAEDRTHDDGNNASSSMDMTLLVTTLELVALEKLIAVRQVMVRELHSEQFPVVNEFEALYTYKCGLYEECMELCRHDIDVLLFAGHTGHPYAAGCPEMLCLLDGEFSPRGIKMLTLLLYLIVRCQRNLHSESLNDTNPALNCAADTPLSLNVVTLSSVIHSETRRLSL